jgi:hypothetical protein
MGLYVEFDVSLTRFFWLTMLEKLGSSLKDLIFSSLIETLVFIMSGCSISNPVLDQSEHLWIVILIGVPKKHDSLCRDFLPESSRDGQF